MPRERFSHNVQDEYYTPKYAVDIIVPYISQKAIWCPFDTEDSNFVKVLRDHGHIVHATHIQDGHDFLEVEPDFEYDVIVSNPPFSLKKEILEKCIALNKPFALLLPFTMFNSIGSVGSIANTKVQFLIMDRRISFNGDRPNFTCWYVCHGVLPSDVIVYKFSEDPRKLYEKEMSDGQSPLEKGVNNAN